MTPADADLINQGRTANLVLGAVTDIITEMTTQIMENAVSAHRAGDLDQSRALVAWGKVDAIWGLRETLESQVIMGEAASVRSRALDTPAI